jgi:hypothetical protein
MPFLIEPYIAEEGVTILYGKSSLGKSPLAWALGLGLAAGVPMFGLGVSRSAPVYYIEVDAPGRLVRPRLKLLSDQFPPDIPFYADWLQGRVDVLSPSLWLLKHFEGIQARRAPRLVIVNTLRKVFKASANDSEVPSKVYDAFRAFFPLAAILFIHHDKKSAAPQFKTGEDSEDLSGSLAWLNDAQVGLHLRKNGPTPGLLRLDHTKSNVSELHPPLILELFSDGSHLSLHREKALAEAAAILALLDHTQPARQLDQQLAAQLGCSEATARRRRLEVESGGRFTTTQSE